MRRVKKRFIILISIVALLHLYIGLHLIPYLVTSDIGLIAGMCILAGSVFLILFGVSARFIIKNQNIADILSWLGLIDMGLFSSCLVLTFIRQIIFTIYGLFEDISFLMLKDSAEVVVWLSLLLTIIGFINARLTAKVVEVNIPIKDLPTALQGFTIAQISDIHVGPTIKGKFLKAVVDKVNELQADVVAITGDLVDGRVQDLAEHTRHLAELNSRYGSFFVLGNHEYYSGAEEWISEVNSLNITVLLNDHRVISHNGENLVIAGVTDYSGISFSPEHASDPAKAIENVPKNTIKILLAHQPRSAMEAAKYGYNLQLSGHTHGGQFWPWNFFVRFQQPFTAGLGKVNNMWVYTNRGTGYWGPPKRLGKRSEITLIRLVNL